MHKNTIAVIGRVRTEEDLNNLEWVEETLKEKIPYIDVLPIRVEYLKVMAQEDKTAWRDRVFDITCDMVEGADLVLLVEPVNNDTAGTTLVSWMLGYGYCTGTHVAMLTDKTKVEDIVVCPVFATTLHAHFLSMDELLSYDFENLPFIPYKGNIL